MLKLKVQYFGHLMLRTDSLEKTLMLGKIEGGRRRGQQRMRWLDGHHQLNGPWVWVNSGSWWWTGRAGMLQSMRSQRVGHNWVTELICHEVMGPDAMILVFWMLSFTPNFTLYFTLIKRLLSSSLVSAVWVISSAYLRLLIFLLTTLVPACDSFRLAFHMMYSACKLNK